MDKKRLYLIVGKIVALLLIGALVIYLIPSDEKTKSTPISTTSSPGIEPTQSPGDEIGSTTDGLELGSTTDHPELDSTTDHPELDSTTSGNVVDTTTEEVDPEKDELLLEGSQKLDWWLNLGQFHHEAKFYLFNVTNPEEAGKPKVGGEKIKLEEIGPIKFEQKMVYDVESWDDDLEHMNIRIKMIYSPLSQRDLKITTLNFPLVAVYKWLGAEWISREQRYHIIWKVIPKFGQKLFITKTSEELLFEGYEDPSIFKLLEEIEKEFHVKFGIKVELTLPPSIVKDGRFSLMASRNDTDYGLLKVATGKRDKTKLGHLAEINGNANVGCWDQPCSRITGSPDGIIHPRVVSDPPKILTIFSYPLNRSIPFDFQKETLSDGPKKVLARRFVLSKRAFLSGDVHKQNKCYLSYTNERYSYLSGISVNDHCNSGAPFIYSLPHFYDSDYEYDKWMEGLEPDRNKHESYILLCKSKSLLLKSKKNLQVNLNTDVLSGNLGGKIIPLFWSSVFSRDTFMVSS